MVPYELIMRIKALVDSNPVIGSIVYGTFFMLPILILFIMVVVDLYGGED